jgi:hypothetical protein
MTVQVHHGRPYETTDSEIGELSRHRWRWRAERAAAAANARREIPSAEVPRRRARRALPRARLPEPGGGVMKHADYKRIVRLAHDVRVLARNLASYEPLEEAIERAHATAEGRRAGHPELLQTVRELARLHGTHLAGAATAPEPVATYPAGSPTDDPCAPAPAKKIVSMGAGSAPEPGSAAVPRVSGSRRGSHAPAPSETLAFTSRAGGRRRGPAAS